MRIFYEEWQGIERSSVIPITEIEKDDNSNESENSVIRITELDTIRPLVLTNFEDFPLTAFFNISFSHHSMILRYAKTLAERKYYIQLVYDQRLKVDDLEPLLKAKVYDHRDKLPNNFFKAIPDKRMAMQTLKMFKDEYFLDYINIEDIEDMAPIDIDERVIEKEIVMNIKNFIMTFGKAFTLYGASGSL